MFDLLEVRDLSHRNVAEDLDRELFFGVRGCEPNGRRNSGHRRCGELFLTILRQYLHNEREAVGDPTVLTSVG